MSKDIKIVAGPTHAQTQTQAQSQRPRLGRGLSSLIGAPSTFVSDAPVGTVPMGAVMDNGSRRAAAALPVPGDAIRQVEIADIAANPYQPRREFDPAELDELRQSIQQQGILQPLIIATGEAGSAAPYVLVAGERRLRAAKLAGLSQVPCVLRQATRQQMLEWALVENIQRTDLNPMEKAKSYRDYVDRFGLTAAQAAERLGQARPTVSNHLRLLELHADIQQAIASGQLSFGHAKILAGLTDAAAQLALATRIIQEGLSVRQVEGILASRGGNGDGQAAAGGADAAAAKPRPGRNKPPYIRDLEERLTQAIGTRVTIHPGRAKNSGRIVIDYYTLEDFDRIAAALGLAKET